MEGTELIDTCLYKNVNNLSILTIIYTISIRDTLNVNYVLAKCSSISCMSIFCVFRTENTADDQVLK